MYASNVKQAHLDRFLVLFLVYVEVSKLQTFCPISLVQIHQHGLLKIRLPVINCNRVIVSIQAVNEGLYRWLIDMTDIRGRLPRLSSGNDSVGIDEAEGINDYLAFHRLDGINYDSNRSCVQGLK